MANFVLIHGGAHGAWCWKPLMKELAKAGHRGFAFDFDGAVERFFNDLQDHQARMYYDMLTPQPFAPYLEPVKISARGISGTKRYIICLRDRTFPRDLCLGFASKLGTEPETLDAGHDAMLSRPAELARLLTNTPFG